MFFENPQLRTILKEIHQLYKDTQSWDKKYSVGRSVKVQGVDQVRTCEGLGLLQARQAAFQPCSFCSDTHQRATSQPAEMPVNGMVNGRWVILTRATTYLSAAGLASLLFHDARCALFPVPGCCRGMSLKTSNRSSVGIRSISTAANGRNLEPARDTMEATCVK